MALQKQLIGDRGQVTSYHRISSVREDYNTNTLEVRVNHYAAETYRALEKAYDGTLAVEQYLYADMHVLPLTDADVLSRDALYERLKSDVNLYADATDC